MSNRVLVSDPRNGHGYQVFERDPEFKATDDYYFRATPQILDLIDSQRQCLVTGSAGCGKSTLMRELGIRVLDSGIASSALHLSGHISGGTPEGCKNALTMLDVFSEKYGSEGIVFVDNVDYYGYSGSNKKRKYSRALAHVPVAEYLAEMVNDEDAPAVVGMSHTSDWRSRKWRYVERDEDEVTPAAQRLLAAFAVEYSFDGVLNKSVAEDVIQSRFGASSGAVLSFLRFCGDMHHNIVSRMCPETVEQSGGVVMCVKEIINGRSKIA